MNEDTKAVKNVFVMSATGTGKTKVTNLGNVSTNPTWSPDGKQLAFGAGPAPTTECPCQNQLYVIKSTPPFGSPTAMFYRDWDYCIGAYTPMNVDRYLAWSPDGTTIAVFSEDTYDAYSWAIFKYEPARQERASIYTGSWGSCCGYQDFADVTWGPSGYLGYTVIDYGNDFDWNPPHVSVVYPGFSSMPGDRAPAPSPLNSHMAFVNANSGTPKIYVSTIAGAQRKVVVTNGYQPDWQPLP